MVKKIAADNLKKHYGSPTAALHGSPFPYRRLGVAFGYSKLKVFRCYTKRSSKWITPFRDGSVLRDLATFNPCNGIHRATHSTVHSSRPSEGLTYLFVCTITASNRVRNASIKGSRRLITRHLSASCETSPHRRRRAPFHLASQRRTSARQPDLHCPAESATPKNSRR